MSYCDTHQSHRFKLTFETGLKSRNIKQKKNAIALIWTNHTPTFERDECVHVSQYSAYNINQS